MPIEIELKAHIRDKDALGSKLSDRAEYLGAFEKIDTMWYTADGSGFYPYGVRIRRETRVLPESAKKSKIFVTYKDKKIGDGIETNREEEFEVRSSSGRPEEIFENFLRRMGLIPGAGKRKQGKSYRIDGITAELLEVDGLGWFIELEIIADNDREDTLASGKNKLFRFLDELGVPKDAIESRPYLQMLAEL